MPFFHLHNSKYSIQDCSVGNACNKSNKDLNSKYSYPNLNWFGVINFGDFLVVGATV